MIKPVSLNAHEQRVLTAMLAIALVSSCTTFVEVQPAAGVMEGLKAAITHPATVVSLLWSGMLCMGWTPHQALRKT